MTIKSRNRNTIELYTPLPAKPDEFICQYLKEKILEAITSTNRWENKDSYVDITISLRNGSEFYISTVTSNKESISWQTPKEQQQYQPKIQNTSTNNIVNEVNKSLATLKHSLRTIIPQLSEHVSVEMTMRFKMGGLSWVQLKQNSSYK